MARPNLTLSFPPGIYRNGTEYETAARFFDGNLVRFHKGSRRPIGGWANRSSAPVVGKARALHTWLDLNAAGRCAIGTHSRLYSMSEAGNINNITPATFTAQDENTSTWSIDNGGEQLFAVNDGNGVIYEWLPADLIAEPLANAPSADSLFMTDEDILVAVAAGGDPRNVAWSDVRNHTQWTAAATNFAGDLNVASAGALMCGTRVLGGSLVWSTEDLHFMQYLGLPDVYGIRKISDDCGIIARGAFVTANDLTWWMGHNNFFTYAGVGLVRPLPCDIHDFVFGAGGLNRAHANKCRALHVEEFTEIWFLFPRGSATEPDYAAVYNYGAGEGHWTYHQIFRLCGIERGKGFDYPMMVDANGQVSDHERGQARGSARYFLRSGPLELSRGAQLMQVNALIPDEETSGDVEIDLYTREFPNGAETAHGPFTINDFGYIDLEVIARQAAIRFREKAGQDGASGKIGTFRVEAEPAGEF